MWSIDAEKSWHNNALALIAKRQDISATEGIE
jgi:hypothetical protein